MGAALHGSPVMRRPLNRSSSRDLRSRHSVQKTALGAVATTLLVPALVLVVLYPVAAVGLATIAAALGLAVKSARRRVRRRRGERREFRVPKTDVSVEL